jgi:hypothetical protein
MSKIEIQQVATSFKTMILTKSSFLYLQHSLKNQHGQ